MGVVVGERHRRSAHREVHASGFRHPGDRNRFGIFHRGVVGRRQAERTRGGGRVGCDGDVEGRYHREVRTGGRAVLPFAHRHQQRARFGGRRRGGRDRHRLGAAVFGHAGRLHRQRDGRRLVVVGQRQGRSGQFRGRAFDLPRDGDRLVAFRLRVLGRSQGEGAGGAGGVRGEGDVEIRHCRVVRARGRRAAASHRDRHLTGDRMGGRGRGDRHRGRAVRFAHRRRVRRERDLRSAVGPVPLVGQRQGRRLRAVVTRGMDRDRLVAFPVAVPDRLQVERVAARAPAGLDGDPELGDGLVVRARDGAVAALAHRHLVTEVTARSAPLRYVRRHRHLLLAAVLRDGSRRDGQLGAEPPLGAHFVVFRRNGVRQRQDAGQHCQQGHRPG